MAATATRRAQRAARHAARALRRRKIPEVLAAVAAVVVLAVGGAALEVETSHDGGTVHPGHGMFQQFDGGMQDGPRDHPHSPWEH